MLNITQAVTTSLRRWRDFSGRSRRSEFWWTTLFVMVLIVALTTLDAMIISTDYPEGHPFPGFSGYWKNWLIEWAIFPLSTLIYYLAFIPLLSVGMRRMHDVGRSGWWMIVPTFLGETLSHWGGVDPIFSQLIDSTIEGEIVITSDFWMLTVFALILTSTFIISFIFAIFDSHKTENKYGPSPKYGSQKAVFD